MPRAIEKELLPVVQSVERAGPEAITVFKQRRVASGCGASGARAGGRDHTRNQAPFYEFATKIKGKKETRAKCHSLHILTTMFRALGKKRRRKQPANVLTGKKEEARARGGGGGAQRVVVMGNCGSFQGTGSLDSTHLKRVVGVGSSFLLFYDLTMSQNG